MFQSLLPSRVVQLPKEMVSFPFCMRVPLREKGRTVTDDSAGGGGGCVCVYVCVCARSIRFGTTWGYSFHVRLDSMNILPNVHHI